MKKYILIDRPITPFSSSADIDEWIELCRLELSRNPESQQWADELSYAEGIVKEMHGASVSL